MISVRIKEDNRVSVCINDIEKQSVSVSGNAIFVGNVDEYKGDYEVTPKANEETVLNTKNKTMLDDVKVLKVPFYETSNQYGDTVYIASEV